MPEGRVKWFSPGRGYGFIAKDEGGDIFVHRSDIVYTGVRPFLSQGQRVSFDIAEGEKGPKAVNVRVTD